jgi:hypothetical protein
MFSLHLSLSFLALFIMTSEVVSVPELIGTNYLAWKRNMIDILRGENLWCIINGDSKKPTDAKELVVWEEHCEHERGLIGKTVSDSLQVHIEVEDNPIKVWKTLASLYDKTDDVSAYYMEKKIHELDPKYFERIESFLAELKTYNEKLNACGKDYKKIDTTLIILVEQKFPSYFDMFIQTQNRAIEMSNGSVKTTFEEFCKGLICEQDRLISSSQLVIGKAHLAHSKKNPHKGSHENTKPHAASTSNPTSNGAPSDASKKKVWKPCKHCGKTNHAENNFFKRWNELEKEKKKSSKEQHVALSAYFIQPGNSSSFVEWIMDSGASNHMTGIASLFTSYDKKNTRLIKFL